MDGLSKLVCSCLRYAVALLCIVALNAPLCASAEELVEEQNLRERLTEREDENRVEDPWTTELFGRPLSVVGQYEVSLTKWDRLALGSPANDFGQLLLEQELEIEGFYTVNSFVSVFGQVRLIQEEDLDSETRDDVSDLHFERGEFWLHAERIADSPVSLEVGRLNFEDDRLWWWDDDLDAVRAVWELDDVEVAVAWARELAPARSDEGHIEPEHNKVARLITEISWDWSDDHCLQLFALSQDDQSRTQHAGEIISTSREDESDADLTWAGLRAAGAWEVEDAGVVGYWLDIARVRGNEVLVKTLDGTAVEEGEAPEPLPGGKAEVEDTVFQDVRGWAFDMGITWMLSSDIEPRVTAAYAWGSGDKREDGTDKAFRQTGLHSNEPGFGGVQRFQGYGELLDPELSNISILTLGIGCSLFEHSSLDLVYHDYRLVERADSLRDSWIETELTGSNRELGYGFDLILGLEEWETVEFELSLSAFRGGSAFGPDEGEWVLGGFFAGRVAF